MQKSEIQINQSINIRLLGLTKRKLYSNY